MGSFVINSTILKLINRLILKAMKRDVRNRWVFVVYVTVDGFAPFAARLFHCISIPLSLFPTLFIAGTLTIIFLSALDEYFGVVN